MPPTTPTTDHLDRKSKHTFLLIGISNGSETDPYTPLLITINQKEDFNVELMDGVYVSGKGKITENFLDAVKRVDAYNQDTTVRIASSAIVRDLQDSLKIEDRTKTEETYTGARNSSRRRRSKRRSRKSRRPSRRPRKPRRSRVSPLRSRKYHTKIERSYVLL